MGTLMWLALIATGTLAGFWVASAMGWTRWMRPSHSTLAPPTPRAHLVGSSGGNRSSGRTDDFVGKQRARGAVVGSSPVRRITLPDQQDDTEPPPKRVPRVEEETSDDSDETSKTGSLKKQPGLLFALEDALQNVEPARRTGLQPNDLNSGHADETKLPRISDKDAKGETPSHDTAAPDKAHPVNDWWLKGKDTKTEKKKSVLFTEGHRKDAGADLHDLWLKRLDDMLGNHPLGTFVKEYRTRQ